PESAELFTHRVGRTGRMDREGEAITLLTGEDMPAWQKIQRDLGLRLQPRPWPLGDMPLPELPAEALVAPSAPAPTPRPATGGRMGGGRDLGRWRSSRFGDGRR
ncbi:MAG: DEAD/DEAH box helicase, partial [Ktedonobacterales bacterium]